MESKSWVLCLSNQAKKPVTAPIMMHRNHLWSCTSVLEGTPCFSSTRSNLIVHLLAPVRPQPPHEHQTVCGSIIQTAELADCLLFLLREILFCLFCGQCREATGKSRSFSLKVKSIHHRSVWFLCILSGWVARLMTFCSVSNSDLNLSSRASILLVGVLRSPEKIQFHFGVLD
jgi:hypothetical protein